MELVSVKDSLLSAWGIDDVADIPGKIMSCLNSSQLFDSYKSSVPDTEREYLQHIYQHYLSDREVKKQDYTPESLADLVANLVNLGMDRGSVVVDLCAGSGALSLAINRRYRGAGIHFICVELDEGVIPFLLFNLCLNNIRATIIRGDVLNDAILEIYEVAPGEMFSSVTKADFDCFNTLSNALRDSMPTAVVSNPPFNLKQPTVFQNTPKTNNNFAFWEMGTRSDPDQMVFIFPNGVLSSEDEKEYRGSQLDRIDHVISVPGSMFQKTSIPTCLLCWSHKPSEYLHFIDASNEFEELSFDKKGDFGGLSHTGRTYHKVLKQFNQEHILKIANAFWTTANHKDFSVRVPKDSLDDGNIAPGKYIKRRTDSDGICLSLNDLARKYNELQRLQNATKLIINENTLKQLGHEELLSIYSQGKECTKIINDHFERYLGLEGIRLVEEDWLTLTKNLNQFEVRQQGKSEMTLSNYHLCDQFVFNIKQINIQKNEVLIQLRDKLIPLLISGNLIPKEEKDE